MERERFKQIKAAVKEKCAQTFQLSTDDLDTEVESCECCSNLERLITLLKEKVRNAPWWNKIQLLSLEAESWTMRKTIEEFSATEHVVTRARKLKEEKAYSQIHIPKEVDPFLK